MKFLNKIITELLAQNPDVVFIKKILREKQYSGFLPNFFHG